MDPFFSIVLPIVTLVGGGAAGMFWKGKAQDEDHAKKIELLKKENANLIEQSNKSGAADTARLRQQDDEIKRLKQLGTEREEEFKRVSRTATEQANKIKELTGQIAELTGAVEAAEQMTVRIRGEATAAATAAEEAKKNAVAQAAAEQAKLAAGAASAAELTEARKAAEEAQLVAQIAQEELAKLQARVSESESAQAGGNQALAEAQAALTAAIAERDAIQVKLGTIQQERDAIQAELTQARAEQERLQNEIAEAAAQRTRLETDLTTVQTDLTVAQGDRTRLEGELSQSLGEVGRVQKELEEAKAEGDGLEKQLQKIQEFAEKQVGKLQEENRSLKSSLESAQTASQGAIDAASLKRMEDTVKSTNLCLRSVVEAAMEGIVLLNKKGDITSWNRAAARMFGYTEEDARGRNLTALLVPDDRPTLKKGLDASARNVTTNEPERMEVLALCKDGKSLPIEVAVAAWASGNADSDVYYTATMRDVTERRQAEDFRRAKETAEESNRAKSQFLANMSHELRTPLNAIIGFSEILHDRTFGDLTPKQDRYVGNILQSGRHLLQLINDILDLAKVDSGTVNIEYGAFPVLVAVRNVENLVKVLLSKKNIGLEVDIPTELPVLIADQTKFKQIIYNLVSNAIKFTPDGGKVSITAWAIDNNTTLQVAIKDTGIGIKPEDQERVFREFEQVDNSYARQQQGTGLGLALVRKFVSLHGGKITVFSEGEGKGTTFTFTMPFAPPEEDATDETETGESATAADIRPAGPKPIVLVVEDDQNASELLTHHLETAGYVVSRTGSGVEAVTLAKEVKPSLITLDVQLNDMDGWEVLDELKKDEATKNIPVVMVSIVEDRDRALAMGVVDTFTKPVPKERLLNTIAKSIQASSETSADGKVVLSANGASSEMVSNGANTNGAVNPNAKRNGRSRG